MERLEQIANRLNEYDKYLQRELRQTTDKNVSLYEQWIDCAHDVEKLLKELTELKKQGRLLKLPCKVGDLFYEVNYADSNIIGHKVSGFGTDKDNDILVYDELEDVYAPEDIFFTPKEAWDKLEEMEE